MDRPLTVKEVSDFLKTKCPNHIVAFGFSPMLWARTDLPEFYNEALFNMVERISVSHMIGNLSHAIREDKGSHIMSWPLSPMVDLNSCHATEHVTMDTLEEMGMKSNE